MVDRLVAVGDDLTLPAAVLVPPRRVVSVKPSGADDTTAVQTALTAGGTVRLDGAYSLTSTLTIATTNTLLDLAPGTNLTTTVSAGDAILVTAADVTIHGGTITSPATWDGANVAPTYAVIRTTAHGLTVDGVTLVNVPKVGIFVDNADDLAVTGCRIIGNYPPESWSGTQTAHFGIAVDPGLSGRSGRTVISGNIIRSCVQGAYFGNYGAVATGAYGALVVGNVFDGCHNHGVYNAGGLDACTVTGNTFTRCSLPIAMTGPGHVVSSNTIFTHGTGNNLDLAGISMREPVGCTVIGNTIKGDAPTSSVIIDLGNYVTGSTAMMRNVVAGNTIDVAGGSSVGIRIGRSTQSTTCHDNVVSGNVIRAVGAVNVGLITLALPVGAVGTGNKITGNTLVVLGNTNGVYIGNAQHTTVQDNSIRFEFNAGSGVTLGAVLLAGAVRTVVSGNDFYNAPGFGTNVTVRGMWEAAGCSNSRFSANRSDSTGLAGYTHVVIGTAGSDAFMDEAGTGAPANAVMPGSRWSRLDGGASTSFYVKETASSSTTWRAV